MYPPMELDGGQKYYLKPMNCPFHVLIFKSRQRSYRELPLRFFEFGSVYRYEKSGVVHGLTRVRGMTQDDAHIFCTREQMADELASLLTFVLDLLRDFGLNDFYLELSTRPRARPSAPTRSGPKRSQRCPRGAGRRTRVGPGPGRRRLLRSQDLGAGPRRHWPHAPDVDDSTGLPAAATLRGDVHRADNARTHPIMIHRALFGSVERFMAVLIEHYAGNMPTWLSPEQVRVLGVRDDHDAYARYVADALALDGVRIHVDEASEPLGARIRKAKLEKIPYILVVGDDDVEKGTLGVNARGSNDPERGVTLSAFRERLAEEIAVHGSPEAT
jgi:threonyl-tRNA synthetase